MNCLLFSGGGRSKKSSSEVTPAEFELSNSRLTKA